MTKKATDDRPTYQSMQEDYPDHERQEVGPEHRFDAFLFLVSLGVFVSVLLGMNSVLDGEGVTRNALVLFVALIAAALSWQANKSAFHIGSKLAAAGDFFTIILVVGWFMLMATVVGTIGFAGVSREIVEGAHLRAPIAAISSASRQVGDATTDAKRVVPLISAGAADLQNIASCEVRSGCVSGRRGRGPTVGALEGLSAKFRNLVRLYQQSDRKRAELAKRLDGLASKYEEQLSRHGVSGKSRAQLLGIYTEAQSLVTEISGVLPTAATRGLIGELRGLSVGPARPGRIDVGARLRSHADRLEEALGSINRVSIILPRFPSPSGIAVGWERLDLTWPLALLLFGIELILIILWLLMVRDFRARRRAVAIQQANASKTASANRRAPLIGNKGTDRDHDGGAS